MGYDSLKKKVGDYSKKKSDLDEEDLSLSYEELEIDSIIRESANLDADLQEKLSSINSELASERERIDSRKTDLETEKKDLSDNISSELGKLSDTKGKLKKIESLKYGKSADKARNKCEEYINQLNGLLDELGDNNSFNSSLSDSNSNVIADKPVTNYENADTVNSDAFSNNVNTVYGNGEFVPLLITEQSIQTISLDGKEVDVFDHPFAPNNYRICNQGSAYPTGPRGTCGCCSCGTIINKAGGNTNEHDIVAYAWDNKLCADSGGTSPSSWVGILGGAGIESHVTSGTSLEDLADYVEKGHGVVIGVSACTYRSEKYGHYFPGKADGHALVLESVIRDHKTGKIIEYVVSDSNGKSRDDACYRVPAKVMKRAFRRKGKASVVTDEVIW